MVAGVIGWLRECVVVAGRIIAGCGLGTLEKVDHRGLVWRAITRSNKTNRSPI